MNSHEIGNSLLYKEQEDSIDRLLLLKREMGEDFPRTLVLVTAYKNADSLDGTLERIPRGLLPLMEEITIFDNFSPDKTEDTFDRLKAGKAWDKLRFYRNPRHYDYGDNLKVCFDYAVEKGFDQVVILRGDGLYDPACLPRFLLAAVSENSAVVLGDRTAKAGSKSAPRTRGMRLAANRLLSIFEELVLGIKLKDYFCGFRLFHTDILKRIPYHLNSEDYLFDLQILIQIRCLGIELRTVPVTPFHDPHIGMRATMKYAARALGIAVGYRLHQLHILRSGTYFVDLGEKYTLKRNRYSSHMQILAAIPEGADVLDLGCGQSLLGEEYVKRGVTLVGVDKIPEDKVSPFVHRYVRQNLENPVNLPDGRIFDYVVLSDLIEHIVNRDAVMDSLRRLLKVDGRLIISTGNIAIWFYRLSLLLGRFEYGPRGILDRTHVHLFTLDSFRRFLKQNGYRIVDVKTTPIPFEILFSSTGRSRIVDWITGLYYSLSRLWPKMFAYQFILECTFAAYESASGEEEWAPGEDVK